jgi:phosphatidylglycerophosphate synthase
MSDAATPAARRPLKTRQRAWAIALAARLARGGASPNGISALSIVFAAIAGSALLLLPAASGAGRAALLVAAAAGIQLRLLCNLLDGMVAVEGGRRSKSGEVWNDAPDRLADLLILVPAGYALSGFPFAHELGWTAGCLALITAYVRLLGGATGLAQDFSGPMAKPHRMAAMTAALLLSTVESAVVRPGTCLYAGLAVVAAGSLVTALRRLVRVVHRLEGR